jgi:hypothetical protein
MSSNSPKLESPPQDKRVKPKKMSQERLMIMFTLFFIIGILLLIVFPEEHAARGIAMGIYSVVVFWALFRFCM